MAEACMKRLCAAVEEARDGAVFEDFLDRARQKRSDREHGQVVEVLRCRDWQCVGDNHFACAGFAQALSGWVGEDRVGRRDDDILSACVLEDGHSARNRAAGVDHVVDEDADAVLDVTDHGLGLCLVRNREVAGLVDERQWCVAEALGPHFGDANAAGVWGDDRERLVANAGADVVGEQRDRHEVGDRPVEKPWICEVCRSTDMMRSAPAVL